MEQAKIAAIVNPRSGNGRTGRQWAAVKPRVAAILGASDDYFTAGPMHAATLARQCIDQQYETILSVGGDGTHNEVTNGFVDRPAAERPVKTALAVLPLGTGGDLRKSLGLPRDPIQAAQTLKNGRRVTIDAGMIDFIGHDGAPARRAFINIASFGIGGVVDAKVNKSTKLFGGKASFFIGALRALLTYRNQRVRMTVDGGAPVEQVINNVAAANGCWFGGGMYVAPGARLDDEAFDIVVLGDSRGIRSIWSKRLIYSGRHLTLREVSARHGAKLYAEPVDPAEVVLLDIDGEQPGRLPATFTLLPGVLDIVAGPDAKLSR